MTRVEHLKFCSICINQQDSMRMGIICGLTNQVADFEENCNSFIEDTEVVNQLKLKEIGNEIIEKMASMGKRFLNYLLDLFFIILLVFMSYFIMGIVLTFVEPSIITDMKDGDNQLVYLVSFVLSMIYYISFEVSTGRSIAKYITRTKVVTETGEKPMFKTILIRTLCRFIPFEAFSALFNDGSGWHDSISNTKVINI